MKEHLEMGASVSWQFFVTTIEWFQQKNIWEMFSDKNRVHIQVDGCR